MENEKLLDKLNSLFKEELWGRIEPKDIGISKFKILDDFFNNLVGANIFEEILSLCNSHLAEHPDSITAAYLIGLIGYHTNRIDDTVHLKKLIDIFINHHKWAVSHRIAEKILEYGENKFAFKTLASSLERLGRNKEAIPVWENLLKIDRFDAEVAKKLAFAIIDDDPEKSIQFMKLSIEGFIKAGDFDEIVPLWNKLVSISWDDGAFFDRIERMLVDARQLDLCASLLKILLIKYKDEENPDFSIEILKKILSYTPEDTSARRELIKFYEKKYSTHSQFAQFQKISRLNNFKYPVKHAIRDFEDFIIFDQGNYVHHRTWGVGKIVEIDSEKIVVNFRNKEEHRMSIQMALQSLTPIGKNHLYVMDFEEPETLKTMFRDDFMGFFEILIKSYNGSIVLNDIKKEIIPKYIDLKSWSKWWYKMRTEIKKNPIFAFSAKKKDLIVMREKPVTFAEELLTNFIKATSFSGKLDMAIEFVNNIDIEEGRAVVPYFIDYFGANDKEESHTKQVLSYFILRSLSKYIDEKKLKLDPVRLKIIEFIKQSNELPLISIKISSYDYKKDFVNLIVESREDWPQVISEFLFETPVRIHKYIINHLIQSHSYNHINHFIDRVITGAKQYPEIFFWVARNLLTRSWDYEWLDFSRPSLILTFFRLMNELKKIETKGNRLKNMSLDILFDNEMAVARDIAGYGDLGVIGKVYDLFKQVSFIEESHLDKFYALIKEKHPNFAESELSKIDESWDFNAEKLIVSREGYNKMLAEFNRMVNVDLVTISREIARVSNASGDLRENVEYNALMEKQTILKMTISKLDEEIKKVEILDLGRISAEKVGIGTVVHFETPDNGERGSYCILGPWDADYEKRILSYRSPIAISLIGKKVNDEIAVSMGDDARTFKIVSIEKYTPQQG